MKGNMRNIIKHSRGVTVTGTSLPVHLQRAWGRYVARLMFRPAETLPRRSLWLRDLPIGVWDLESMGFKTVVKEFIEESHRLGFSVAEELKN